MALSSALCAAVATTLIQRGLRRSNFYAGFWINIAVGVIGLWSAVLVLVPFSKYNKEGSAPDGPGWTVRVVPEERR
jgi:hypothetical protein